MLEILLAQGSYMNEIARESGSGSGFSDSIIGLVILAGIFVLGNFIYSLLDSPSKAERLETEAKNVLLEKSIKNRLYSYYLKNDKLKSYFIQGYVAGKKGYNPNITMYRTGNATINDIGKLPDYCFMKTAYSDGYDEGRFKKLKYTFEATEDNFSPMSSSSFNLQKPEMPKIDVCSTEVTEEDLANAWVEEFGVKYSADRKRLLNAGEPVFYGDFSIRKETLVICDHAFSNFRLDYGDKINLSLPEGLNAIGNFAFSMYHYNLEYLEIPSSVVYIGKGALRNCLEVVCHSIHYKMVDDCLYSSDMKRVLYCSPKLASIIFPDTVTIIESGVFSRIYTEMTSNNYLRSISLPNNLYIVDENDLAYCENLTSIYIPSDTKDRFEKLLPNYKDLIVELKTDESLYTYVSKEDMANVCMDEYDAIYSNDKRKLLKGPTDYDLLREPKYSITAKYSIRDGTEVICDYALAGSCTSFDNGWMSGENVNSIDELYIPNSVTHIGRFAFSYCGRNNELIIPQSVVSIDVGAFAGCLFIINCLSDNFICFNGFFIRKIDSALLYYYRPHDDYHENNGDVTIPDIVKRVEDFAFYQNSEITSIVLPYTVTSIGANAFKGCDSLEEILIPPKSMMKFEQMLPNYKHLLKEV